MKKHTSLSNSSMQELLLLHWAAVPSLFRPRTLWSRSWRLICWQLLWLEGPAPTLHPRQLQYECERVTALTWMRAFSNMQGSFFAGPICSGSTAFEQNECCLCGISLGEGIRISEQSLFTPLPQMWSHMCIIIRGGIRSQDFTVLKLFYLSFAVRLWSTEANPPSVCRATEDISVFEAKWINNRVDSDFALRVRRCTLWASMWGDYSHILEMGMHNPLSITDSKNNKGSTYAFISVGF